MICRSLRLETVAGLGIALAMCVLPMAARAESVSTETTLNVTTHAVGGQTKARAQVTVAGTDGTAATGVVAIYEGSKQVAGVALDSAGSATSDFTVAGGAHALRAVYEGDTAHMSSASTTSNVTAQTGTTPGFTLSLAAISPSTFPMTLTAGTAGTATVTVVPQNNSTLSSPMFVTLSCSGLPDQSSCTFSPASVEILPSTANTACASGSTATTCPPVSTMVLQTQAAGTARSNAPVKPGGINPVAWALLIPGALGFGGLAWGARRKLWLSRVALIALMAVIASLGLSGCNPQYSYYHHGPDTNLPTPAGTYNLTITGQATDGISDTVGNTTMVLVVK
jgi:hypothetical protein